MANPPLVLSLVQPPIDRSLAIVIAVLFAFFVGNVFMLWVSFVQQTQYWLVRGIDVLFDPLWKKFLQYLVLSKGNPPRQNWLGRSETVNQAYQKTWDRDVRFNKVAHNWQRIATRILKFYKVDLPEDVESWTAFSGIIGRFKIQDFRGPIMLVATAATGWGGLAAMYFAPRLHTRYFFIFCFFPIGIELLDGFRVASNLAKPEYSWSLGTLRALEELKATVGKDSGTTEIREAED